MIRFKPVSLTVPIHNRDRYLAKTIASILAQTHTDFELILWDNHSTDRSLEIARHYASLDPRVRVVAAPHQGQTRSLHAAFALATGTYLGWVDSDDLLAPTALAETINLLNTHPQVGMVYTQYQTSNEHDRVFGLGQRCQIPYSKNRLLVEFMVFHFRLMRRSTFEQVGGINETCDFVQDYDLCLRFSEVTQIQQIQQPLYYYRTHPQSMSQQQQLDMITASQAAVIRALNRRGLSDRYALEVEIAHVGTQLLGKFSLRKRG